MTSHTRDLFDTAHPFDAGLAGFDGPTDESEGFKVALETTPEPQGHAFHQVIVSGPDGEVIFPGIAAMRQARDALVKACEIAAGFTRPHEAA